MPRIQGTVFQHEVWNAANSGRTNFGLQKQISSCGLILCLPVWTSPEFCARQGRSPESLDRPSTASMSPHVSHIYEVSWMWPTLHTALKSWYQAQCSLSFLDASDACLSWSRVALVMRFVYASLPRATTNPETCCLPVSHTQRDKVPVLCVAKLTLSKANNA